MKSLVEAAEAACKNGVHFHQREISFSSRVYCTKMFEIAEAIRVCQNYCYVDFCINVFDGEWNVDQKVIIAAVNFNYLNVVSNSQINSHKKPTVMPISDKKCTFGYSEKDPAQNDKFVPKNGTGTVITEPYMKRTDKGEYMMVMVEAEDGTVREVFATGIKILK